MGVSGYQRTEGKKYKYWRGWRREFCIQKMDKCVRQLRNGYRSINVVKSLSIGGEGGDGWTP